MVEPLLKYIVSQNLLAAGEKMLVATSGGVDSVVLCHLFQQAGLPFAIAHCNFQLRGEESHGDELFVKQLAQKLQVPFFSTRFNTQLFAEQNKRSIQQAARQLRYEWLEETRQSAGCQLIATAHHLDDSIETLLYNFAKGCGLRGLHGIPPRNGHVIRPLLFATKRAVLDFAQQHNIAYREDASNFTDKYARNLLRHHVVPVFEKINPNFQHTAGENIERLREAEQLYDFALQKIMDDVVEKRPDEWRIDLQKLRTYPAPTTVLFEMLKPHGFNNDQVADLLQNAETQPGKWYYSSDRRLLVDRAFLVLPLEEHVDGMVTMPALPFSPVPLPDGAELGFQLHTAPPPTLTGSANTAWLDVDQLQFPLRLRRWQAGDSFCPLGMGGKHQKLQDFFSNHKLSRLEKERVWLLESGGEIAWVVGMRLDERFKVTSTTKTFLCTEFRPEQFLSGNI